MDLKDGLSEVEPNGNDGGHGSTLRFVETLHPTPGVRKGVVHVIKWAVQRVRYMTLETIAPLGDDPMIMLSAVPAA